MWVSVLYAWIVLVLLMVATWCVYLKYHNPCVIDVMWPVSIFISGMVVMFHAQANLAKWLVFTCALLWALRLACFLLFTRVLKGFKDPRYETLSDGWKRSKAFGYFFNYQFQAILALIIGSPFWWLSQLHHVNVLLIVGLAVSMLALLGEAASDRQLQYFVAHYKGKVCDQGLWKYSRHPNYFFECLVWVGFSLVACSVTHGWIGFVSPILLFVLMHYLTAPMTEKNSIKSKGELYLAYQKKTRMIIPFMKLGKFNA